MNAGASRRQLPSVTFNAMPIPCGREVAHTSPSAPSFAIT